MKTEWHQLDMRYERLRARCPHREKQLIVSLAQSGQLVPITVILTSEPDSERTLYLVIDGFRRIRAMKTLRRDRVEVTLLDLPELDALLYHHAQRSQGDETILEQAWLAAELAERFGLSLGELAHRFGQSTSWVSRRLALARELPVAVQELVRGGRIGAHAAMRSLVPLARTKAEECEQLAVAIAPLGLTSREIEAVVEVWRESQESVKKRILENPRLFLEARQETLRAKSVDSKAGSSNSRCSTSRRNCSPEPGNSAPRQDQATPSADAPSRSLSAAMALLQDLDLLATLAISVAECWPSESPKFNESQWARARQSLSRARSRIEWITSQEAS